MGREKQNAQQAKDLLTLCLAKAIQDSLSARLGANWFQLFLQDDHAQDPKFQIARNGQTSIRDMDLQALLKILRYRDRFADHVFAYYRFGAGDDAFAVQTKRRQIRSLLDRLITDYRNSIEAHSRVADLEQEPDRIYGYREALQDMRKLASIFKPVCDSRGISYYSQIEKLCKPKKRQLWWIPVVILAAIGIAAAIFFLGNWETDQPEEPPTTGNVFYSPRNVNFESGEVYISLTHVYYEDDTLVAKAFITNGLDRTVSHIDVTGLIIYDNDDQVIAQAAFGELEDLVIAPQGYVEWTFVFPEDTLLEEDGALPGLNWKYACNFK